VRPDGAGVFYQSFSNALQEQVKVKAEDIPANTDQKDQDYEEQKKPEAEGGDRVEQKDYDQILWEEAKKSDDPKLYKHYLSNVPDGKYRLDAQRSLRRIELERETGQSKTESEPEPEETDRLEQKDYDQILWEEAKKSDDPELYKHYLSNVPDGKYRLDAQRSLRRIELERAAEQSKPEPKPEVSFGNEAAEPAQSGRRGSWVWGLLSFVVSFIAYVEWSQSGRWSSWVWAYFGFGVTFFAILTYFERSQEKSAIKSQTHKSTSQQSATNTVGQSKIQQVRTAAEHGIAEAQTNLGWMYETGRGVAKDKKEAVRWYRLAAEQGYANAQYNLGVMYMNGPGVTKDEKEAVRWYRLAAEQGYASAQYNLGVMYANGQGVAKDEKQAVRWYRKAAEQNDRDAKKALKRLEK
jgi:alpha/beta superfamily hydrolase